MNRTLPANQELLEWDAVRPLAPHEFDQIRQLAYRTFGLDLKQGKEELVSARLRRLVRGGGFRSFQDYYQHVVDDQPERRSRRMIDALATNHTSFLREPDHFDFLRQQILPTLAARRRVEIWSAACSTGEEVWTLAFLLNDVLAADKIGLMATDISNKALAHALRAVYSAERCGDCRRSGCPDICSGEPALLRLRRAPANPRAGPVPPNQPGGSFSWPRPFPVVFCRNVMIYFDRPTQEQVVNRIADYLEPGGYLFVGHAESLTRISHDLEYVRPAVYRKTETRRQWNRS